MMMTVRERYQQLIDEKRDKFPCWMVLLVAVLIMSVIAFFVYPDVLMNKNSSQEQSHGTTATVQESRFELVSKTRLDQKPLVVYVTRDKKTGREYVTHSLNEGMTTIEIK